MAKFIFTYGSNSKAQPYQGGWTEIEAADLDDAIKAFLIYHPSVDGFVPCAFMYSESEFAATNMPTEGCWGVFCREKITLTREVL